MVDKEIVPYVAPKSRQGDPLSPMEQYFTEALQEEAFSVTATSPATPRSTPRRKDPRGARGRSADHPSRPTSPRARSSPGFSGGSPSPGGVLPAEVRRSKPQNKPSKKKLEVFAVKLFQDENAPGPRLKPDEEYVHSWVTKEGRIISHDYRRNKISPDEPPLQPRLTIFGVRPPARAEDYQDKSEIRKLSNELTKAHMANVRLDTSQQRLREEVREMQEDLDLYFKFLDERMDRLVEALGIQYF